MGGPPHRGCQHSSEDPILAAAAVWGHLWKGSMVLVHCDNAAVVEAIFRGKAKDPLLAHQLRALFYIGAYFDVELTTVHTLGRENGPADALSRDDCFSFFAQVPSALRSPTEVPWELQVGLSQAQPAWSSPDWTRWFANFITRL